MEDIIRIRAKRILSSLERFTDNVPMTIEGLPISMEGDIVGIYDNRSDDFGNKIVITNKGLYLQSESGWLYAGYFDISVVDIPDTKSDVNGIKVLLLSGEERFIPITGGSGRFRDVFPFLRFINHAIKDVRQ